VVQFCALILGVALVMLGLVGLLLAEGPLFSALASGPSQDALRLASGGLLVAAGSRGPETFARAALGSVGLVYRLLGVLGALNGALFGLLPGGYTVADTVLHLVVGGLGVALAWGGGRRVPTTA
jgi:hypothetical protein